MDLLRNRVRKMAIIEPETGMTKIFGRRRTGEFETDNPSFQGATDDHPAVSKPSFMMYCSRMPTVDWVACGSLSDPHFEDPVLGFYPERTSSELLQRVTGREYLPWPSPDLTCELFCASLSPSRQSALAAASERLDTFFKTRPLTVTLTIFSTSLESLTVSIAGHEFAACLSQTCETYSSVLFERMLIECDFTNPVVYQLRLAHAVQEEMSVDVSCRFSPFCRKRRIHRLDAIKSMEARLLD